MSILQHLRMNICSFFKHILPSQPCLLCGAATHRQGWCEACDADLPFHDFPQCPVCALPTPNGEICGHCLQQPPHFSRTIAAFDYAFPLDQLVQALKFGNKYLVARPLVQHLNEQINSRALQSMPDFLLAMPLHRDRVRERGYNQSMLLAKELAKHFKIPILAACHRLRNTQVQSTLPWKERSKNLRNAFQCSAEVAGKHIAIVDDVMTTGSSVNELSKALQNSGAREISVWVIARTLPDNG